MHKAYSEGTKKRTAAGRLKARVSQQEAVTVADAMRRVQPKHKGYVMARAAGMSPAQAWTETQTNALQPERSGRRLEESPIIKAAIKRSEEVVLRGSLMSAAQRRDWVLDRLIVESEAGGDSARVRSLELLGKTAGLFIDRAEVSVIGGSDSVRERIEAMLASIAGRTIEHEASIDDPYLVLPDPDSVSSEGGSGAV
jgi:hypothetical protein